MCLAQNYIIFTFYTSLKSCKFVVIQYYFDGKYSVNKRFSYQSDK